MKPFWEITQDEMKQCLEATEWCPAVDFFRGGGYSTRLYDTRNLRLPWLESI